ncbi:MAG: DUF2586 family protein [Treponema sp.]|nr:DUF2586 family protein [Treponema sp.]
MPAAVDTILDAKLPIERIAVAGVSSAPLWAALAAKAEGAESACQYLFFITQARYLNPGETVDQWAAALAGTERGATASARLQICAAWLEEADSNGQADVRGIIGVYVYLRETCLPGCP